MSLVRLSGLAGITSAVLAIGALAGFAWVVGGQPLSEAAASKAFFVPTVAALLSVVLLGLALVGLYLRQAERFGALGTLGFVVALVGTMLAAGAQWTYVFVVPHIADAVPDLVDVGSGVLLVGFLVSYAVLSAGWVLFGIATLRAGIFRRWMGVLLLVGAVIAFLPLPSRTLVLAVGVAALGSQLIREPASGDRGDPRSSEERGPRAVPDPR